jgi:hypothetical protein
MGKICFECGIKGETWTGPIFSSADKLRVFYQEIDVSDPIVEKMQEEDLLCSKCVGKAECRHALKVHKYYKEKWNPEQYEIWVKSNANLIAIAETELKEQEKTSVDNPEITTTVNLPNGTKVNVEKLAIIDGNPIQNGQSDSTGQAIINSDLATKFEAFCTAHMGKIIDWNMSQQKNSENWFIFIRYVD